MTVHETTFKLNDKHLEVAELSVSRYLTSVELQIIIVLERDGE